MLIYEEPENPFETIEKTLSKRLDEKLGKIFPPPDTPLFFPFPDPEKKKESGGFLHEDLHNKFVESLDQAWRRVRLQEQEYDNSIV